MGDGQWGPERADTRMLAAPWIPFPTVATLPPLQSVNLPQASLALARGEGLAGGEEGLVRHLLV